MDQVPKQDILPPTPEGLPKLMLVYRPQKWECEAWVKCGEAVPFDGTMAVLYFCDSVARKHLNEGRDIDEFEVLAAATGLPAWMRRSKEPCSVTAEPGAVDTFVIANGFSVADFLGWEAIRQRYGVTGVGYDAHGRLHPTDAYLLADQR